MSGYGDAGRVGVIDLSTCTSLTAEFALAVPTEVLVLYARLRLPRGEVTVEALDEMFHGPRLEEAAFELSDAGVSAITFACTSGSLLHGPGFDRRVCDRITAATGVHATTTATSAVRALHALGLQSVCVGTPYDDEINERERQFFEAAGIAVKRIAGLGIRYDRDIGSLSSADVRELASSVWDDSADGLFLSCTNLPALTLVGQLEAQLGRPVVTSNSATIWDLLRTGGVTGVATPALGRLGAVAAEAVR